MLCIVANAFHNDESQSILKGAVVSVAAILLLIVSGWVIKQKGRRLWWILLTPVFSPLWLKNKKEGEFVSYETPIQGNERHECLTYYEEEKKLRLLYERVAQLCDKRLGKYEKMYSQARKARSEFWSSLDKIYEVREYMLHAATEIVRRKKEMRLAPSSASAMSSAWLAAYLDYEALSGTPIVASSHIVEFAYREEIAKESFENYSKSIQKAWKEEKEFRKRLKISSSEYQSIVDYADIAVAADEWLRKLEAECP